MKIKIGTRPSLLALKQVDEIRNRLPDVDFEVILISTRGDKDKSTSLEKLEGSDFFTYEIERSLERGDIDVAVHSAKDLEMELPGSLMITAMTSSISTFDCLISRTGRDLDGLGSGSVIGTSSKTRKKGIKEYRDDLEVSDIRGNVDERIAKLDRGDFDAIIVAHAALIRLGLESRITQIIPHEVITPHPLQGRLAVQIKKDRPDLEGLFKEIDER